MIDNLLKLQSFIEDVKQKRRVAMFGPGYVVLSQQVYRAMCEKIPDGVRIEIAKREELRE